MDWAASVQQFIVAATRRDAHRDVSYRKVFRTPIPASIGCVTRSRTALMGEAPRIGFDCSVLETIRRGLPPQFPRGAYRPVTSGTAATDDSSQLSKFKREIQLRLGLCGAAAGLPLFELARKHPS